MLAGRRDRAGGLFWRSAADQVWERTRCQDPELYCFYQYLVMEAEQKPGQLEALVRLLHSHTDESRKALSSCSACCLKLDDSLYDNSGAAAGAE